MRRFLSDDRGNGIKSFIKSSIRIVIMGSGLSYMPIKGVIGTSLEGESNISSSQYTNPNQIKRSMSSEFNFSVHEDDANIKQELLSYDDRFNMPLDPILTEDDLRALESITVPIPLNEGKRLKILRQSNLFDSTVLDPEFDRFTSLAHRIFEVSFFTLHSMHHWLIRIVCYRSRAL